MVIYTNIDVGDRVNDLIKWIGKCTNKTFISNTIETDYKYGLITKKERNYLRRRYGF